MAKTGRRPSTELTDPDLPPTHWTDGPGMPGGGPMGPGGGPSGTRAGTGGAGPQSPTERDPAIADGPPVAPPPSYLSGGPGGDLFLGNYVPLSNYLYANSGRVAPQVPATPGADLTAGAAGATNPAGTPPQLGTTALDQGLAMQGAPVPMPTSPAAASGTVDPAGGGGGTGSQIPSGQTPTKPNVPRTQSQLQMSSPATQVYDPLNRYLYRRTREA